MGKYLGSTGLTYLWGKIKSAFVTKTEVDELLSGKEDTISDLTDIRSGAVLGATALQSYTETDPTVPAWAKQSTKPSYTASEVGALPDTYVAPVTSVNGQTGAVSLTIPSAVTESTVTGWGFTKNGGTVTSIGGTTAVNNIQVVSELPASPDANTLYLIPET